MSLRTLIKSAWICNSQRTGHAFLHFCCFFGDTLSNPDQYVKNEGLTPVSFL